MNNTPNAKSADYNRDNFHGYSIQLSQLEDDLGGGWYAYVPELPGCQADGDTPDEALEMIKDAIDIFVELAIEDQRELPSPQKYSMPETSYSGRISLRLPREMHRKLAQDARLNDTSLNQYLVYLLSYNGGRCAFVNQLLLQYVSEHFSDDQASGQPPTTKVAGLSRG